MFVQFYANYIGIEKILIVVPEFAVPQELTIWLKLKLGDLNRHLRV